LAGFDFVAGGEHGLLNLCAIQMRAVGASFVDDAAAVGTALDGEVRTGHMVVMRNGELGTVGGTADEDRLAIRKRDIPAGERTCLDVEDYSHALVLSLVWIRFITF
jgi:hypothetical protein